MSPHRVTSIASATSGAIRVAAGPAPRMPSSSCTAAVATTVAAPSAGSRRMTSTITAQPERSSTALPVKTRVPFKRPAGRANVTRSPTRTPSSSVASRLDVPTSTNISSSGIAFLASSGGRTCAGFAPVTPSTGPLRLWMRRSWSITMRSSWYPTGAMRTKPSSSTCWTTKPSSSMCAHSITVGAPSVPVRMKNWLPSGSDSWRS